MRDPHGNVVAPVLVGAVPTGAAQELPAFEETRDIGETPDLSIKLIIWDHMPVCLAEQEMAGAKLISGRPRVLTAMVGLALPAGGCLVVPPESSCGM